MERYFAHMKTGMAEALNADPALREGAFTPAFTKSDLIDFALSNILTLLMRPGGECGTLLEIIRRAIYAV